MKKLMAILSALLVSSAAFAAELNCQVSEIDLVTKTTISESSLSDAHFISKIKGQVDKNEQIEFLGKASLKMATMLFDTYPVLKGIQQNLKISNADLQKGVLVYHLGSMQSIQDDASGIIVLHFTSVKGKPLDAIFYGWAGLHKCN